MNAKKRGLSFIDLFVMVVIFPGPALPTAANTLIRGEFEYDVDEGELSEWQLGPAFVFDESPIFSFGDSEEIELEIPFGQDDGEWFTQPEITYETEFNDFSFELGFGAEINFSGEPIDPFLSVEGSVDF